MPEHVIDIQAKIETRNYANKSVLAETRRGAAVSLTLGFSGTGRRRHHHRLLGLHGRISLLFARAKTKTDTKRR